MVMWDSLGDHDVRKCSMVDDCVYPDDSSLVKKTMMRNFERHYKSNKYWLFFQKKFKRNSIDFNGTSGRRFLFTSTPNGSKKAKDTKTVSKRFWMKFCR